MSNLAHYRAVADVMARHQDLCMALTAHRRARTVVIELGIVCILLVISMVIFAMPVLALPVIPLVGVAFLIGHRIDVSAEYGDDLQVELARTRAELAALSRGGNGVDNTGGN